MHEGFLVVFPVAIDIEQYELNCMLIFITDVDRRHSVYIAEAKDKKIGRNKILCD